MYKLSRSRIFIILAICVLGLFFAIPNMLSDTSKLPKWWQPVNLGLDLQGGSNLLLEVKMDDVLKERMSSIEDSARQVLRESKIRYQNLKAGSDAVIPLYLIKPIAAKGNAPKIQTQLRVSVPNRGRRRKYKPIATPQARTEKMNCLSDSPKNILSV